MEAIEDRLEREEGKRRMPYLDCCGKSWRVCVCAKKGTLTIGIGRNLDDVGISENEIEYLLQNDLGRVRAELDQALPWWRSLDMIRQQVMVDLGFNLGVLTPVGKAKLLTFTTTLELIRTGQYAAAAARLRTLPWHGQVGRRAIEIEAMLDAPVMGKEASP
jgi:lysozyme